MKIGLIIADTEEYKPVEVFSAAMLGTPLTIYGYNGHRIELPDGHTLCTMLCGIGKVNAATAAAHLISGGAEVIINCGLSGGLSGIKPGEYTVGTRYVEHDFDLTPLGLNLGQKPNQKYIYPADGRLLSLASEVCPAAKQGVMVCGDCFVSDSKKAAWLIEEFDAMSCDMESAAIASVCHRAAVPFVAVRQISDSGDESAVQDYNTANSEDQTTLFDMVLQMIYELA